MKYIFVMALVSSMGFASKNNPEECIRTLFESGTTQVNKIWTRRAFGALLVGNIGGAVYFSRNILKKGPKKSIGAFLPATQKGLPDNVSVCAEIDFTSEQVDKLIGEGNTLYVQSLPQGKRDFEEFKLWANTAAELKLQSKTTTNVYGLLPEDLAFLWSIYTGIEMNHTLRHNLDAWVLFVGQYQQSFPARAAIKKVFRTVNAEEYQALLKTPNLRRIGELLQYSVQFIDAQSFAVDATWKQAVRNKNPRFLAEVTQKEIDIALALLLKMWWLEKKFGGQAPQEFEKVVDAMLKIAENPLELAGRDLAQILPQLQLLTKPYLRKAIQTLADHKQAATFFVAPLFEQQLIEIFREMDESKR